VRRALPSGRPGGRWLVLAAAASLLVAGVFGTRAASTDGPAATILFTGSVHGFLDQCGCARFPLGGVDRRSGYIRSYQRSHADTDVVLLDTGNFFDTPGAAGDVKSRALVEAMNRLGYVASGVGERDLLLGIAHFRDVTSEAAFPFVSANLVRRETGRTWLPPATVVSAGGLRIAVLGVTRYNPTLRLELPGGGTVVTVDPVQALQTHVAEQRDTSDLVVVLAALPLEDARLVARQVRGIDLILGSHGARRTAEPIREGGAEILYGGDEGKYFGEVALFGRPGERPPSIAGRLVDLGPLVEPDERFSAFIIEALAEAQNAERLNRTVAEATGGADAPTYLGAGACTPCHASIVEDWSHTAHRHAWQTLQRDPASFRYNCIPCHVTGSGQPGGFLDETETPHLLGVGCEACHGPGAAHVSQPERPYGRITMATCTSCHTAEMDPSFNYYRDRQLVSHGEESAGP
jgi:hypothetical protein